MLIQKRHKKIETHHIPRIIIFIFVLWVSLSISIYAQDRIPRPEFQTDYQIPEQETPSPRLTFYEYLDVAVLFAALGAATYLALRRRSRTGIFFLMLFSLFYFGFWRKGCVCPVGSIQNIVLLFSDPGYRIPLTVVFFFTLPLLFTLFFGRTFCAAVCPLGAIQDLFILRPVRLPVWVSQPLSLIPYIYLALAALSVATGAGFLICRFDPFVGIFRVSAQFNMLIYGAGILIAGTVIARPYCRFLCPYGVLLKWVSKFSRWHLRISPDQCIECRLCEESCPFDAIKKPVEEPETERNIFGVRRLLIILLLLPVLIFSGSMLGSRMHVHLSRIHPTVRLAERIHLEESGILTDTTLESRSWRETGRTKSELTSEAFLIRQRFKKWGYFFGGFLGLVFIVKLIELSIRRKRESFEPDRATCFSCGRCFEACVKEQALRKETRG